MDICLGDDYEKKEEVNTKMAVYTWNNTIFMSEKEIKSLPEEKKVFKQPPKWFDISKAERIIINKAELKV